MNLFRLNMNFFKSRTEKVSCFLIAGSVENEPPVLNEPFLKKVSMKFREKRKLFIISLKFRAHLIRAAHFPHPRSISTSRQLKSLILFLFEDFHNNNITCSSFFVKHKHGVHTGFPNVDQSPGP